MGKKYQDQIKQYQSQIKFLQEEWGKSAAQATQYGTRLRILQSELDSRPIITVTQLPPSPTPLNHENCINQIIHLQNENRKLEYEKWRTYGALVMAVSAILNIPNSSVNHNDTQLYYSMWDTAHPKIENDNN